MPIIWDLSLAILSVAVALLGSFAAFIHLRQMRENTGYAAFMWLFAGASSLGLTIWSANFIGLMALHFPVAIDYSPVWAIFAGSPAIIFSALGFYLLRAPVIEIRHIANSSLLIGVGVSLTQFACLNSLAIEPSIRFNPITLSSASLLAIAGTFGALSMGRMKIDSMKRSMLGALIMGASISIGHFAVAYWMQIDANMVSTATPESRNQFSALLIFLLLMFWFFGSVIAMLFDKRIVRQNADALVKLQKAYEALDSRAQKLAKDRSRSVLDKAMDAVVNINIDGLVIEWNTEAERVFGYSYDEAINRNISDLIIPEEYRDAHRKGMMRFLSTGESHMLGKRIEINAMRKNGEIFPIEMAVTPVRQQSELFFSAFARDITERKMTEQQIHKLAYFDALTQLPNRRLLRDRIRQAFASSARSGVHGAVLLLDLDHFKTLNDSKGHEIGDMLLIEVSKRLTSSVRDGDTIARLGGDEFLILLELSGDVTEAVAQAELIAEKVRAVLSLPYQLKETTYHTTPSIGIALFKGSQESVDDLLKHADAAMYQAKKNGRNAIRFYDPVMQAALEARTTLEEELRQALAKQQFHIHFQVQVDSLKRPVGAEVLLRWERPDSKSFSSPLQYITLAEDTNLIIPIGLWVIKSACAQLKAWQENPLTRELILAVNVSAKQFRQADFVNQIQNVLLESGAKPSQLKLELTESTVLENVQDTIVKMRELKLLGVDFSMDDFGTGYSSLQYLKRLPLSQIKIDQSFVRDITSDPNDAAIVQTIIAMSHALGLNVIAEGVETVEQMNFLDKHGCHTFQGYLFSKPLPISEFEALLQKL